ncbi:beta-galactosidase [Paenibacillus sp. CAU 1782]
MEYAISVRNAAKSIYPSSLKMNGSNPQGDKISFTNYYMEWNGKPFIAICGEYHYARYDEKAWDLEIGKMKMSGINVVATYIFWNHHEETEGNFNWSGNRDLRKFVELCARRGLHVILRVGPFCHGEVRNGGLPDWLFGQTFEVRSNDEGYLNYVRRLYGEIGGQVEGLMFKDGGPVIGIQLENELNAASAPWEMTTKQGDEYLGGGASGEEGIRHMRNLKTMAEEAGLVTPIYTSTGWDNAPLLEDEVLPLYGGYAYTPWSVTAEQPDQQPTGEYVFQDYHNDDESKNRFSPPYPREKYPFACCEMGGGMQTWYLARFQVEPESVSAMTMMKLAGGCNFVGYYMFHGGTNPMGETGYLNENTTPRFSYDFQAPIGEFGQIRPSNDLLRPLHYFLQSFGERLAPLATVLPDNALDIKPENGEDLRYAVRSDGNTGFLFVNNYQDHVEMSRHENIRFALETANGGIVFPRRRPLTIEPGASLMLPFRFDLGGALLIAATCQPVTQVKGEDGDTYFFRAPGGQAAELLLDTATFSELAVENGKAEQDSDGVTVVSTVPGKSALIQFKAPNGRVIRLYVMTEREAATMWQSELGGERRIFFSDAACIVDEEGISFVSEGKSEIKCRVYDAPGQPSLNLAAKSEVAAADVAKQGWFSEYTFKLSPCGVEVELERLQEHKVALRFPNGLPQEAYDVLLHIRYTGNVGYAFSGGQLLHDHFYNGKSWELGLSHIRENVRDNTIVLQTTPLRKGKVTIAKDAAMAVSRQFEGEAVAAIHGVKVEPIYRLDCSTN